MTDAGPSSGEPRDQLRAEAASWFARMRGEEAAGHQAAFAEWLARGAAHRAAYNRIGEVFAAGKMLKNGSAPGGTRAPRRRWAAPLGAAVASAGLLFAGVIGLSPHGWPFPRPALSSSNDQSDRATIRSLRLPRGGQVVLDADAELVPVLPRNASLSRLERGRVRFLLARRSFPLHVLAGSSELWSRGGVFDLWLRPDGSLDTLAIAGDVRFAPAPARAPDIRPRYARLVVGQHYLIDPNGHTVRLASPIGLDWPQGILEYRGAPLRDVVEEANRYSATKILLADPTLGDRRVSGRFRIDDPVKLARRLASALALDLDDTQAGRLILSEPKKKNPPP